MHTTVMMAHPSRSEYAGKPLLIVVLGPTAVGKTAVAIQLAQRFGCDIVSADSRQVFRQLNVGVARPSDEELHAVKHHLVAHRNVWERYSCGQYAEEAKAVLARLFTSKRTAILTGGSMLYISALCNGIEDFPTPDPELRARLTEQLRHDGVATLAMQLATLDPKGYDSLDTRNGARVLRALEITIQTGRPYSEWLSHTTPILPFNVLKIGLILPMESLEQRISARVDDMISRGLEAEARQMMPYRDCPSLRTVGYRELFDYFDGRCSRQQAIACIKTNTRRYAKRQMTWWKRETDIEWFSPRNVDAILEFIRSYNATELELPQKIAPSGKQAVK